MTGITPPALANWCPIAPLCLLPIGSTAKPIFAAAILSAQPRLANLVLRRSPADTRSVLGLPLGRSFHNTHPAAPVSFNEFLRNSDNYYAASLLLLGSPAARAAGARCRSDIDYSLGGPWISDRPRSAFEGEDCRTFGAETVSEPFRPVWATRLLQYFDVNPWGTESLPSDLCTGTGRTYFGDDFHDAAPWASLFRTAANRCAMPRSSPLRPSFGIDSASSFSSNLVPLILGDGNGRWSTVKLAEAFSRIVTGREIRATFLSRRYAAQIGRAQPDALADFEPAQAAVTAGMAQVFAGTAAHYTHLLESLRALQRRVPQGYVLGAFAKTGTMQVPPQARDSCPSGADLRNCWGSSFALVVAIYGPGVAVDPATGRARAASAVQPLCAITIIVNLPAHPAGRAADLAGAVLAGGVSQRLVNAEQEVCDGLS